MTAHPPLPQAIRYIPLLPRARPPALPPRRRITELNDLLHTAAHTPNAAEGLVRASEAMNKAALIASDTGKPAVARHLCWQHYDLFTQAAPLTARAATLALQPLVNLGRLAIRAGQTTTAYEIFDDLFAATTHEQIAIVEGRACAVADLVSSPPERLDLRRFLWAVLLADGTRALCSSGRWQDALAHLHRHNGIGKRLLDGRQVAVIAALQRHEPDTARKYLEEADCLEQWEKAMAACLTTTTVRAANHDPTEAIAAMTRTLTDLPTTPGGAVFAARIGTLACELAPRHRTLAANLINSVMGSDDAHAAAVVLDSPVAEMELSPQQHEALHGRVARAELASADLPPSLAEDLAVVCDRAAAHLTRHLGQLGTHPTQ
ncbi:hypothetical protein [Nocardiopsis rhodophaea]|uniref:hypothetical protein n=1 Tax=Nocardiopsis rhodophaea TaxID=280238 RepID=UPI0031CF60F0